MDFEPDFDAVHVAVVADFAEAGGDVLDGGLAGHTLGEAVGPHFDSEGAGVVREADELLGEVDLLLAFDRVVGLELAGAAEAQEAHFAVLEAVLHLEAFGFGERGFDAVFVSGAKFDGVEAGGLRGSG